MKGERFLLLTFLLVLRFVGMKAQTTWQHIEGLPCEETSAVTQDADGYIWIGTRLALLRYDGYDIETYRNDMAHPHAFSSCNILCLAPGDDGLIWAGAFFGMNVFDTHTGLATHIHFGSGNDYIHAVVVDHGKRCWIGTGSGLYCAKEKTDFEHFGGLPRDQIVHIRELTDGRVVVATRHHGLYQIDRSGQSTPISGTEPLHPTAVCSDKPGNICIGTREGGLYLLHDGMLERQAFDVGTPINDLLPRPRGEGLLIATAQGVFTYPQQTDTHSLAVQGVKSLFADRDGNVWAATENQGVFFLKRATVKMNASRPAFLRHTVPMMSQFSVQHLSDTLLWAGMEAINAICEGHRGRTYIGTQNDGFYITENGRVSRHLTKENTPWLQANSIYAFAEPDTRSLLIGTWNGLYLMDAEGQGRYIGRMGRSDISNMHTLAIHAVDTADVWLGLVGGIAHVEGPLAEPSRCRFTIYTHVGRKGTDGPADVGRLVDSHDEADEYQLGGIYRIVKDRQGRIWACTSEPGLLLYDAETDAFRSVSQPLGILGDNVHSMDIDEYGNFWMTTNYGIMKMSIAADGLPTQQQLYTRHDALPTNYYGSTMSCKLADGTLCFANQQNLVCVAPDTTAVTTHRATILAFSKGNGSLPSGRAGGESLVDDNVVFRLSTLSFGQEPSIRYGYKLDGFDNDYRQTDLGSNIVDYQQLPPGKYTFRYYAMSGDAHQTASEQTFSFEIPQPLWWRWWARLAYVLILIMVVWAVLHYAADRRRRQRQLERLSIEKQQQEQLYEKKMQFYVRVLHDFLTPLTLMSEMLHNLHSKVPPQVQASLFMLSNQTDRLVETMNGIVDTKTDKSASEAMQKAQELTQVDRDFLHRCTESVNRHIADADYSHTVMMDEVGASHATLYRKLKALTGMDATTFIRSIRMRAAYQLLMKNPNIRIGELAERVGYNNARYFSTCFKKEFGKSPRDVPQTATINPDTPT